MEVWVFFAWINATAIFAQFWKTMITADWCLLAPVLDFINSSTARGVYLLSAWAVAATYWNGRTIISWTVRATSQVHGSGSRRFLPLSLTPTPEQPEAWCYWHGIHFTSVRSEGDRFTHNSPAGFLSLWAQSSSWMFCKGIAPPTSLTRFFFSLTVLFLFSSF